MQPNFVHTNCQLCNSFDCCSDFASDVGVILDAVSVDEDQSPLRARSPLQTTGVGGYLT